MTNNRKSAYVDFNQPYYASLSDKEISLLKKVNSYAYLRKSLKFCKTHGISNFVFLKSYDKDNNESLSYLCQDCAKDFGK